MSTRDISVFGSVGRDLIIDGKVLDEVLLNPPKAVQVIKDLVDADPVLAEEIQFAPNNVSIVKDNKYPDEDNFLVSGLKSDSFIGLKRFLERVDTQQEEFLKGTKGRRNSYESLSPSLKGPGGLVVLCYFRAFIARLTDEGMIPEDGQVIVIDERKGHRIKINGKIRSYCFAPKNPPPPLDDISYGDGMLVVDVIHQEFMNDQELIDCSPSRVEAYKWKIELCNATVYPRDNSGFRDLPFPALQLPADSAKVTFPEHSLDPDDGRSLWCRGLNFKLYAEGPQQIKIHDIYQSINGSDPVRLDSNSDLLYKVTDESCVDLMFKGYPPFDTLPPQREYCLGRCSSPGIVNSGGD